MQLHADRRSVGTGAAIRRMAAPGAAAERRSSRPDFFKKAPECETNRAAPGLGHGADAWRCRRIAPVAFPGLEKKRRRGGRPGIIPLGNRKWCTNAQHRVFEGQAHCGHGRRGRGQGRGRRLRSGRSPGADVRSAALCRKDPVRRSGTGHRVLRHPNEFVRIRTFRPGETGDGDHGGGRGGPGRRHHHLHHSVHRSPAVFRETDSGPGGWAVHPHHSGQLRHPGAAPDDAGSGLRQESGDRRLVQRAVRLPGGRQGAG